MSNQPVPAMAIERHAYLAGVGKSQTDYSQTTEVTPGEVTTGFSMTVVPHILDQRRVILQYNINLSSLDEMKEFKTSDVTIELPQVSTQAFSQRTTMKMGQTLVLSGFEKESRDTNTSVGLFNSSRKAQYGKTLLVITIEVESAEV
jgi:type II secretory pathway component GspD/PulD (secretin)